MKNYTKIILINILIILSLFYFLELIVTKLNLSILKGANINLYDLENQKFKPYVEEIQWTNKVVTGKYGERIPKKNYKYINDESIVFIGDSVTFGDGVNEEDTFVGIIRKKLTEFNIYNFAVSGQNLRHYVRTTKNPNNITNIKKIYVFLSLNDINMQNDIVENRSYEISSLRNIKFFQIINNFFRSKSNLYIYIKSLVLKTSEMYFWYDFNLYKEKKNLDDLSKNLLIIKQDLKYYDYNIILLPYEFQLRKDCAPEFLMPQEKIKYMLKKNQMPFLDLTENFCDIKDHKKYFLPQDHMHLSKIGHNYLAPYLIEFINTK